MGSRVVKVDWGGLAVAAAITAYCVWYFLDARAASPRVQNMLLIMPAVASIVVLFIIIAIQTVRLDRLEDGAPKVAERRSFRLPALARLRIPALMGLLGGYVFSLPTVGFDLATFLYIGLSLAVQGERRPAVLIGFSLVFAVALTWAFQRILTVSVPTRFW